MSGSNQLFSVTCKNCGAAVGFDIPTQTYRCVHCGMVSSAQDATSAWKIPGAAEEIQVQPDTIVCPACGANADYDPVKEEYRCAWCDTVTKVKHRDEPGWKKLNAANRQKAQREDEVAECTSCGARVLFRKDEASEKCAFCGGNLIRRELKRSEELPELIIPFVLTEDEAKERLRIWYKSRKNHRDTNWIEQNINKIKGYYLPYRLIRGPLQGIAYRDQLSRHYRYRGFLEHAVVNASGQLDNLVLDAAEPFDLSSLKPFADEYVGGHRVKLSDISPAEVQKRTLEEAIDGYRPYVAKVLQNHDVRMQVEAGDFRYLPILLPMYTLKCGSKLAVVNGQTGKVAVDSAKGSKTSKLWILEPLLLTLIATLAAGYFFQFAAYPVTLFATLAAILFFSIYSEGRNSILHRVIYSGRNSKAKREEGALVLEEGRDVLRNPLPNTPAFYESDGTREARVEFKFYTPGRLLWVFVKLGIFTFLPAILAIILHMGVEGLAFQYGAAWYITAGGIVIIYCTRGLRWDIYNHPIMYEVLPDGRRQLFGSRSSRKLSILALFGLDSRAKRKELGGIWIMIIVFVVFILSGSTLAMIF